MKTIGTGAGRLPSTVEVGVGKTTLRSAEYAYLLLINDRQGNF
jgi:hypothetical protein